MNDDTRKKFDEKLAKYSKPVDLSTSIDMRSITSGLEWSLSTGNWNLNKFRMHRRGITAVVSRQSFIATLVSWQRFCHNLKSRGKLAGLERCSLASGECFALVRLQKAKQCGLVKNLALMTHVTTDEDEGPIIYLCYSLGVEDLELLSGEELHMPNAFLIILNGTILGKHRRPRRFANAMRKLRRSGKIGEFVSIFVNEKHRCVYISSDGGQFVVHL